SVRGRRPRLHGRGECRSTTRTQGEHEDRARHELHLALFLRSFLIVLSSSSACLVTLDLGYFCLMSPRYVRASVQFLSWLAASAAKYRPSSASVLSGYFS